MLPTPHAEVLAQDWLPPVVLGREAEVAEVVATPGRPVSESAPTVVRRRRPAPGIGLVRGGPASGARGGGPDPRARPPERFPGGSPFEPRARAAPTASRSALLRALDDGFDGRGFSVPEILAGFLRRLRREGRPCVLVLDDVRVGGPDLAPILRALGTPDRFLPEGETGIPPVWVVLAGTAEALERVELGLTGKWRIGPFVRLGLYDPRVLETLVEDRAQRAFGRAAPPDLIERIVRNTVADGGGASRAIDLLRRTVLSEGEHRAGGPARRHSTDPAIPIESSVVRAIEDASLGRTARVGDVRRFETQYARERGVAPLPATTFWRRIVRLEQAGYIRREVRPGGVGGTRSTIRLMAPVDEWVTIPRHPETRPASAPWDGRAWSDVPVAGEAPRWPALPRSSADGAG